MPNGQPLRDRTGQRYHQLVVLSLAFKRGDSYFWHCQCDCGRTIDVNGGNLTSGGTKSCGCARKQRKPYINRLSDERRELNRLLNATRNNAAKSNREFTLTQDDIDELALTPCHYCGKFRKQYSGIDRQNNSQGYVKANCVSCCEWCNRAKLDYMTPEDLIQWAWDIVQFNS